MYLLAGVVVYLDITSPNLLKDLLELKQHKKFVGFRKILDFSDNDWLIKDDVIKGMELLAEHGVTFDLLVSILIVYLVPCS